MSRLPACIVSLSCALGSAALAAGGKAATPESILEEARISRVAADQQSIAAALQMYRINAGVYPTVKQGLKALVEKPAEPPVPKRWVKLMRELPRDPWGRPYVLEVRAVDKRPVHFIVSRGPDSEDPADDIEHPLEKAAGGGE